MRHTWSGADAEEDLLAPDNKTAAALAPSCAVLQPQGGVLIDPVWPSKNSFLNVIALQDDDI